MRHLGLAAIAPLSIIILACAYALAIGTNPVLVARIVGLCVPAAAYAVFAIFTVLWAIKTGEVGVKQEMTLQARIYFWHGVSVVLALILSAAGAFLLLLFMQLKELLGHGIS